MPVPVVVFPEAFLLQSVLLHVPVSAVPGSILHLPVPMPVLLSTVEEMRIDDATVLVLKLMKIYEGDDKNSKYTA